MLWDNYIKADYVALPGVTVFCKRCSRKICFVSNFTSYIVTTLDTQFLARYVTNGYKTLPHIGQHCPGGTTVVAPAAQSGRAHLTTCRFDSNMYMYTYVYMYACMCVCIYVCYIHMYTYIPMHGRIKEILHVSKHTDVSLYFRKTNIILALKPYNGYLSFNPGNLSKRWMWCRMLIVNIISVEWVLLM